MGNRKLNLRWSGWLTTALTVAIGTGLAGTALLAPPQAQAIHDEPTPFQLDGNPSQDIGGGSPPVSATDDDWDNAFQFGSLPYPSPRLGAQNPLDPGETFIIDSQDPDITAFVQSNKDVDQINTWSYGVKGLSPPKDDITNAYAKAYNVDTDNNAATPDHLVVYFGSDRFADDGDAAMGYWFFKNEVGFSAPNNAGSGKFTGTHAVGDILIQIDYRGAGNNEIEVFKWVGTGGNAGGGTLQRLAIGASSNPADTICNAPDALHPDVPADTACVTTNIVAEDSPWTYVAKGSDFVGVDRFAPRVFMEGGFDVTALVGNVCFSGFMAETRSSHSETASLKDFAFGNFDLCSIDVEKECEAGSQTVNAADETFTTTHTVTIENSGFGGSLRDVELSDTRVAAATANTKAKTCEITAVGLVDGSATGLAGVGTVFTTSTQSVEVADTLSGTIAVTLECTSGDNPFVNAVSVKSRSAAGQPQDVTDVDLEDSTETTAACLADLNVGLTLKKWCQGDDGLSSEMGPNPYYVSNTNPKNTDDPENPLGISVFLKAPTYNAQVCVDIQISNPSANQRMVVDSFGDNKLGSLLPAGGLTLNPAGTAGDKYAVNACYPGAAPDGADGVHDFVPHLATYTDTVEATGHGKIDNQPTSAGPVSATCDLCAD
jgi:hypothetical protein